MSIFKQNWDMVHFESLTTLDVTINPTGSGASFYFPFGLSERLFNGSYGDNRR